MKFSRIALFALALMCASGPASAQKIFDQFDKPMPEMPMMSPEVFESSTKPIDEPSPEDPALGYHLRIAKDWPWPADAGIANLAADDDILGEIGRFYGPPTLTERSRIRIHSMALPYQMTVRQWLMQQMLTKGYHVQGLDVQSERRAESLYVMIEGANTYVVRSLAQINGKRVIVMEYYVPQERWEEEKAMQSQVIKSFALKKSVREIVEKLDTYRFLDVSIVNYPRSWKLVAPQIKTMDAMGIKLLNLGQIEDAFGTKAKLDGKIEIDMISIFSSETLEQAIERYRTELGKSGLQVQDFIEMPPDFVLNPHFDFAETNVYKAIDPGNKLIDYEFWQTVLSAGDYYYFVTLLTPARDQDYFIWARNTQTYKLIMELMQVQEDSMTEN